MNEEKITQAKKLMEEGWKSREALDFVVAEGKLNEAVKLFEAEGDWYNVTECLNHLAYNEKLKATQALKAGIELAERSLSIAEEHNAKKAAVYRALFSLSASLGNFEAALKYISEYKKLQKKPEDLADAQIHEGHCMLRVGNASEALRLIDEALGVLQKNESGVDEPHISIWISAALLKKSTVLFDLGNIDEAKKVSEEALSLAQEKDLKTRILEIKEFQKNF